MKTLLWFVFQKAHWFMLFFSHVNAIIQSFFQKFLIVYAEFVYVQKYIS